MSISETTRLCHKILVLQSFSITTFTSFLSCLSKKFPQNNNYCDRKFTPFLEVNDICNSNEEMFTSNVGPACYFRFNFRTKITWSWLNHFTLKGLFSISTVRYFAHWSLLLRAYSEGVSNFFRRKLHEN